MKSNPFLPRSREWYLEEFLSGRMKMLSVPAWVFGGKMCKRKGCTQVSYDDGDICYGHRAIEESSDDTETYLQKRLISAGVVRQTHLGNVIALDGRKRC